MKTFVAIGDLHGSGTMVARIPEAAGADGILITGDLTNLGGAADISRVVDEVREVNPNVWAQIGNMDTAGADGWLSEQSINLHRMLVELAPGFAVLGLGYSATTPFGTPSEVPDTVLGQWLEQAEAKVGAYLQANPEGHVALVSHTPPALTATDQLRSGTHVGSAAVREFLERVQPALCLTGHIHESKGQDAIGKTTIINPGMLADGGYVLLTLADGQLSAELKSFK